MQSFPLTASARSGIPEVHGYGLCSPVGTAGAAMKPAYPPIPPSTPPGLNAFRLYRGDSEPDLHFPSDDDVLAALDPHRIALQELIRPDGPRPAHRELEPFSRAWFEELELKRYAAPGEWLRRSLEFTRHREESLLMFGSGAGCDAVQYLRQGTHVTFAFGPSDCPALVRRHFEARGLPMQSIETLPGQSLPSESNRFDLAYLNLLAAPQTDLAQAAAEIYRVLKPGGKLFLLAPAYYDADYFARYAAPWRLFRRTPASNRGEGYTARSLKHLMTQYTDRSIGKRHLRRTDLPFLLRSAPAGLCQRFFGHVLIHKAFKPISAAFLTDDQQRDAA